MEELWRAIDRVGERNRHSAGVHDRRIFTLLKENPLLLLITNLPRIQKKKKKEKKGTFHRQHSTYSTSSEYI
jgi:hypothetical protein